MADPFVCLSDALAGGRSGNEVPRRYASADHTVSEAAS
jgi:hypothetical protein